MSQSDTQMITPSRLSEIAARLNIEMSVEEAESLNYLEDEDKSGHIGLLEFETLMETVVTEEEMLREMYEIFNVFDQDYDGTISCQEIGSIVKYFDPQLTEDEALDLIRAADVNKNGTIEMNELLMLLASNDSDEQHRLKK
ncbi:hypothetical protein ACOME3_010066 [Neoechinorhynchus agilis]